MVSATVGYMLGEPVQHKLSKYVGEIVGVWGDKKVVVQVDEFPDLIFWPMKDITRLTVSEDLAFFAGEVARALDGIMTSAEFKPDTAELSKCSILIARDRPVHGQDRFVEALIVRRYHGSEFQFHCAGNRRLVYQFTRKEEEQENASH